MRYILLCIERSSSNGSRPKRVTSATTVVNRSSWSESNYAPDVSTNRKPRLWLAFSSNKPPFSQMAEAVSSFGGRSAKQIAKSAVVSLIQVCALAHVITHALSKVSKLFEEERSWVEKRVSDCVFQKYFRG